MLGKVRIAAAAALLAISTPAFAQIPGDLVGDWSSDREKCEDNQAEGVTVFSLRRSTVSWYEIDCDHLRAAPAASGLSFVGRCVKGGGVRHPARIGIKRVNREILHITIRGMDRIDDVFFRCKK